MPRQLIFTALTLLLSFRPVAGRSCPVDGTFCTVPCGVFLYTCAGGTRLTDQPLATGTVCFDPGNTGKATGVPPGTKTGDICGPSATQAATASSTPSVSFSSTQMPSISNTASPSISQTLSSSQTCSPSQSPSISPLPLVSPLPSIVPTMLSVSVLNLTASINAYIDLLLRSGLASPDKAVVGQAFQVLTVVAPLANSLNAASVLLASSSSAASVSSATLFSLQDNTTQVRGRLLQLVFGYLPVIVGAPLDINSTQDVLSSDLLAVSASALAAVSAIPTELSASAQASLLSSVQSLLSIIQYVDVSPSDGIGGRSSWTTALPLGAAQNLLDTLANAALSASLGLVSITSSQVASNPSSTIVVYLASVRSRRRQLRSLPFGLPGQPLLTCAASRALLADIAARSHQLSTFLDPLQRSPGGVPVALAAHRVSQVEVHSRRLYRGQTSPSSVLDVALQEQLGLLLSSVASAALRNRIRTADGVLSLQSSIRVASKVQVGVFNSSVSAFCLASLPMLSLAAATIPITGITASSESLAASLAASSQPQLPSNDPCNVPTLPWWTTGGSGSNLPRALMSPGVAQTAAASVGTPAPSAIVHLIQWGLGSPSLLATTGAAPRYDSNDWPVSATPIVGNVSNLILNPSMDALLTRVALSSANGTLLPVSGVSPPVVVQVATSAAPQGSILPDARAALNTISVTLTCPAIPAAAGRVYLVGEGLSASVRTSAGSSLATSALQSAVAAQALPVTSLTFLNASSAWRVLRVSDVVQSATSVYFGYSTQNGNLYVWHAEFGSLAAPYAVPAVKSLLQPVPPGISIASLTTSTADNSVIVLDLATTDVRAAYTVEVPCWPAMEARPVTLSCLPGAEGATLTHSCAQLRLIPVCQWWDPFGGRWSTEGCTTIVPPSNSTRAPTAVACTCNHLTDFSARFRVGSVAGASSISYLPIITKPLPFRSNFSLYAVLGCVFVLAMLILLCVWISDGMSKRKFLRALLDEEEVAFARLLHNQRGKPFVLDRDLDTTGSDVTNAENSSNVQWAVWESYANNGSKLGSIQFRAPPVVPEHNMYAAAVRSRLVAAYGPDSVLPYSAARSFGAPAAAMLRLLPRSQKRGDPDAEAKLAQSLQEKSSRTRDASEVFEANIGLQTRCCRGCGMMAQFWGQFLWLRHPLLSLFFRYDPWVSRASRTVVFFVSLVGPLWILDAWYDYLAEGYISFLPVPINELTAQEFFPLIGVAVAAVVLHTPVNMFFDALVRWAGFAQFDIQHPGIADELRRRAMFEAKTSHDLSLADLRTVVSQLLRVRLHAARSMFSRDRTDVAARVGSTPAPSFFDRWHWKTCVAYALLLAYLTYAMVFITLFSARRYATRDPAGVDPPRGATLLADLLIAWAIGFAIGQVVLQPILLAFRVVWEHAFFPSLAAWAVRSADEGCFDFIVAVSPVPPFALRTSTLGARFASVGIVEAAGVASGLSCEQALVAYGLAPAADGTVMRVVQVMRRASDEEPPPPEEEQEWRSLLLRLYLLSLFVKKGDVDAIEQVAGSGAGPHVESRVNFGAGPELRAMAVRRAAQARTAARGDVSAPSVGRRPTLGADFRQANAEQFVDANVAEGQQEVPGVAGEGANDGFTDNVGVEEARLGKRAPHDASFAPPMHGGARRSTPGTSPAALSARYSFASRTSGTGVPPFSQSMNVMNSTARSSAAGAGAAYRPARPPLGVVRSGSFAR